MINKKWFALLVLLLAACSPETTAQPEKQESEKESIEVSKDTGSEKPEDEEIEETENQPSEESLQEAEVEPLYELSEANWTLKPIGDANPKAVLLTIDDAPDQQALSMAKVLKELDAPAIFFVNGHFLDTEEEKDVLREIHSLGFPIGNHTNSHPNLKDIPETDQFDELVKLNDTIEEIIGERPKFFRAPFGLNTDYSRQVAAEQGMLTMNWTYGYDWEKDYRDPAALADIMVNTPYLTDGAILLMHDREWTAEALRGIVEGLRGQGYDFIDPLAIKGIEQ